MDTIKFVDTTIRDGHQSLERKGDREFFSGKS